MKENEEELRQHVTDLNAKKWFIGQEEEDNNSAYCSLLYRISKYHKDILAKEEKVRYLVMMAISEQLQDVQVEVLKVKDSLKDVEKESDI